MQRILCALDGSLDSADAALAFARLLGPGDRLFTLVCAIEDSPRSAVDPGAVAYYQRACRHAEALLERTVERLQAAGIAAQSLIGYGDPATTICETAAACQADLVVLAPHARHGLRRWLEGSVTDRVMREAPCGVVVYRNDVLGKAG